MSVPGNGAALSWEQHCDCGLNLNHGESVSPMWRCILNHCEMWSLDSLPPLTKSEGSLIQMQGFELVLTYSKTIIHMLCMSFGCITVHVVIGSRIVFTRALSTMESAIMAILTLSPGLMLEQKSLSKILSSGPRHKLKSLLLHSERINIQQLRCLGHLVRKEEDAPTRRIFDAEFDEEDDLVSIRRT